MNSGKKNTAMSRYRGGYKLIWAKGRRYVSRLPHFGEPGTFDPRNHHGGAMPALPGDFHLTGNQAATILEKVATAKGVSYSQVRKVSATLSYLYSIQTGVRTKNWPEVKTMLDSFDPKDFQLVRKSLKPTVVPQPKALKEAFTKEYSPACGWPYSTLSTYRISGLNINEMALHAKWITGLLACWCWALWGCRPRCDLDSLKTSHQHTVNPVQGWASTAYDGGRNKLSGKKSGTRPWSAFFVCMCPGGQHQSVPEDFEYTFDEYGHPQMEITFCTVCPLNCLDIKSRKPVDGHWNVFSKWTKTTRAWVSNHGKVAELARSWITDAQDCGPGDGLEYCTNSGRMALAGWLEDLHAPYHEGFQIHGDLQDVWRKYQPGLPDSNYAVRSQCTNARIATAALRRFQHSCGRGIRAQIQNAGIQNDLSALLMVGLLESQGQTLLAQTIVGRYSINRLRGINVDLGDY